MDREYKELFICSRCGAKLQPNMLNMPKRELTTGERYMICPNDGSYAFKREDITSQYEKAHDLVVETINENSKKVVAEIEEMKKAELISYAKENGIEINPKDRVAEIREVIRKGM